MKAPPCATGSSLGDMMLMPHPYPQTLQARGLLSGLGAHRDGQARGGHFVLLDHGVGAPVDQAVAAGVVPDSQRDRRHRMAGRPGAARAGRARVTALQEARDQLVPAARPLQTVSFLECPNPKLSA